MSDELFELLFNALNEQGYLFQGACEQVLKDKESVTGWEVIASEYPVSILGQDTRVDIVLRSRITSTPELYTLVECKRADRSYSHWLFGAPGLPFGAALFSALGLECRQTRSAHPYQANRLVTRLHFNVITYGAESWLEVKRGSDRRTSTPQNIENAFGQVLKGVGGFAQEQLGQRYKSRDVFQTFFVPVVVTTASLYVAYYETRDVDLSTSKISKDKVHFGAHGQTAEDVEWVLVDYGVGESISPKPIPEAYHGFNPAELQKHKVRSIFVVNSNSLVSFFSKLQLAK